MLHPPTALALRHRHTNNGGGQCAHTHAQGIGARPRLVVGFAAETDDVIANATAKRDRKGCDWIVANDVSPATGVMGGDRNTVHLISRKNGEKNGEITVDSWPVMTKEQVAIELVAHVARSVTDKSLNDKAPEPAS